MENQKTGLLKSWVQVSPDSDFTIYNLPFGIFRNKRLSPRVGIAIGDKIVDLFALQEAGFLSDFKFADDVFLQEFLNPFIGLGKSTTKKVRERVRQLLNEDNSDLKDHQSRGKIMVGLKEAEMMMPLEIKNYTAFISPTEQDLMEDSGTGFDQRIVSIPIGYHGRASSIQLSGTPVYRPKGPLKSSGMDKIDFGLSRKMDFEIELAFVVGKSSKLGESIAATDAEEYLFGMVLLNDWTARDIQEGEGGPFVTFASKNFASSISPWVVTLDALESFKTEPILQNHDLLAYLESKENSGYDIQLEVYSQGHKETEKLLCQSNYKHAQWNIQQLVAQQTINGCTIEIGDLMATGAVSSPENGHYSSILEIIKRNPSMLDEETLKNYIKDGNTLILKGFCERDGIRIGFGEVVAMLLPRK